MVFEAHHTFVLHNVVLIWNQSVRQSKGLKTKIDIIIYEPSAGKNKATRSSEISCQQVQKLTPQFFFYIYIGYRFPLSLSTIVFLKNKFCFLFPELFFSGNVGNSIKCKKNIIPPPPKKKTTPTFDMFEIKNQNKGIEDYIGYRFPLSLSTIWRNHLPFNQ